MRLISRVTRSAGAAALLLVTGLAQAHSGHGERVLDGHVHLEQFALSAMALIGQFAGELAVLTAVIAAFAIWKKLRKTK